MGKYIPALEFYYKGIKFAYGDISEEDSPHHEKFECEEINSEEAIRIHYDLTNRFLKKLDESNPKYSCEPTPYWAESIRAFISEIGGVITVDRMGDDPPDRVY